MDWTRLEAIVKFQVDRMAADLISKFGGGSIRGGLAEKAQDALRDLFEPNPAEGSRAAVFQARFKDMVYDLVNNTAFLNNAKWITGQELPLGYTAASLHEAYVDLLPGGETEAGAAAPAPKK